MGYYPLSEAEGVKLRSLLSFSEPASVIDPCVGQGTALQLVTSDAAVRRYGIELDAERARIAGSKGIEIIQGNTFGDSNRRNYPTSSKAAKRRDSQRLLRLLS